MHFTRAALVAASALILACTEHVATAPPRDDEPSFRRHPTTTSSTIFSDGFEGGTLAAWQDGVDPATQQVLTDATQAHAGTHVLQLTYPAGQGAGWLTRFFLPGYDSLYVSYWLRLDPNWTGSTALLGLRGSRTDNQWSAFGKASSCPTGTDFFATSVVAGTATNPLDLAFATYYPGMPSCTGQSAGPGTTTSYASARRLTPGPWHQVAVWVKLNRVGQSDGQQVIWLDGAVVGQWSGLVYRTSTILKLNSLMLDAFAAAPQTEHAYVDDVVVLAALPAGVTLPGTPPPPPAPVATVGVTLNAPSLTVGQSTQAVATVKDANGTVLTDRPVSWTTSNSAVATVDASGLVKAVSAGSATITATADSASGSATLTVAAASVAMVTVAVGASSLTVGQTTQATATVKDADGNVLTDRVVTWSSSNPSAATVSSTGLVTAAAAGSANIIATSEGKSGSATLTVSAPATGGDTLFVDHFESGALGDPGRWQDIVGSFATIVTASNEGIAAPGGTKILKLAGSGGAISHFVSTVATSPYEHLFLSYKLLRTSAYEAANKGVRAGGIRGSVTQWGSFGVGWGTSGSCPDDPNNVHQQEFMFAYVANDQQTFALRTYTEWLDELKLTTSPPTCGGAFAMGTGNVPQATYFDLNYVPSVNVWHQYEIEVQLNDVGQSNGWQRIWVDGVLKVAHLNVRYRTTNGLKLWAITFDTGALSGGALYVDDVVVMTQHP